MNKTILIGYGNIDRQDDGASWYILQRIAMEMDLEFPTEPSDELPQNQDALQFFFTLQLTPELAEDLAKFDRIFFIDTHTGNIPVDVQVKEIHASFQQSPFTHHLTPETLLSFCDHLYNRQPSAYLISVRGYEFDFVQGISPKTKTNIEEVIPKIMKYLLN
jgi:hydrogenase maturation protease